MRMRKLSDNVDCTGVYMLLRDWPYIGEKQESLSGSEVTCSCIIDHEGFDSVCLNVWVLQAAYFAYRYHYGEVESLTHKKEKIQHPSHIITPHFIALGDTDSLPTVS